MNLKEIKEKLDKNEILVHESWLPDLFLKKINTNSYGIFNKQNEVIENILDFSSLPDEGWCYPGDKIFENQKNMKIGRICQSFD